MRVFLHLVLLSISAMSFSAFAVEHLKLSTTTSTENSGLLDVLNSAFEDKYAVKIDVIAVGTGKALKIGGRGDVDVVFVHAPAAELEYVERGDFIDRKAVMHNDFVIIGPTTDPAGLLNANSAADALKRLSDSQSDFISRADDSGTHKKEMALWQQAEMNPEGQWYIRAGQGMGAVLIMADQKEAYTLTDRGTMLAFTDKLSLVKLFEGDEALFNPYHVMAVNPKKHGHVNYNLAIKYIEFVTSEQGQAIIRGHKIKGKQLFYPDAIK